MSGVDYLTTPVGALNAPFCTLIHYMKLGPSMLETESYFAPTDLTSNQW